MGDIDPKFQHWQFASGSQEQVKQAADFFGPSFNQNSGQIVHSLSTVLVDRDGKIQALYFGNDWKPADVAAAYEGAVRGWPSPLG